MRDVVSPACCTRSAAPRLWAECQENETSDSSLQVFVHGFDWMRPVSVLYSDWTMPGWSNIAEGRAEVDETAVDFQKAPVDCDFSDG